MKGTVLYGPRDVRFEERPTPELNKPTDAVIRIAATCVCGSDLWPYRGLQPIDGPIPMATRAIALGEPALSGVEGDLTTCMTQLRCNRE